MNRLSERRIKYFEEMKNKNKAIRATSAFWPENSKKQKLKEDDIVCFELNGVFVVGLFLARWKDVCIVIIHKGGWYEHLNEKKLIKIGEL